MKNKILPIILCMAAGMCISVLGTLAYLTDRESAVNTFTVGQVDITLDEAKVNRQGQPVKVVDGVETAVEADQAERVTENEYHLIPGQSYVKDPTVTVLKDSEDSYVRMLVTLNYAAELKEIFGEDFLPEQYVTGWDADVWKCVRIEDNTTAEGEKANTITYEFRYRDEAGDVNIVEKVSEDTELQPLFTEFTVPGALTNEQLAKLVTKDADGNIEEQFKITLEGHAIQAAGFTADEVNKRTAEDVAWASFDAQVAGTTMP